MRPVTKVAPATYPYAGAATPHTAIQFAGTVNGNNSNVSIVFNTPGVAVNTHLDTIINHLTARAGNVNTFPAGTAGERTSAVSTIKTRISKADSVPVGYGAAQRDLRSQLGFYCSYCEIKSEELDVEHRLPKDTYPYKFLLWDNYLRSCGRCNSAKGTKPSRLAAAGWTGLGAPTENQLMTAAEDRFFWPDRLVNTYRRLDYLLRNSANGAVIARGQRTSVDFTTLTLAGQQVNVDMAAVALGPVVNRQVEVRVSGNAAYGAINRTNRTIGANLLSLDEAGGMRGYYRTTEWFEIFLALKTLEDSLIGLGSNAERAAAFNLWWDGFLMQARKGGFYSSYVWILQDIPYPAYLANPNGDGDLADTFVRDSTVGSPYGPLRTIPGTDTTEVP